MAEFQCSASERHVQGHAAAGTRLRASEGSSSLKRITSMTTLVERVTLVHPSPTRTAVFASILILFVHPAHEQQQDAGARTQCAIFTVQDFSAGTEYKDYEQPITASVSAAFEVGGYSVIPAEKLGSEARKRSFDARALLAETAAVPVAQSVGAAVAVTGYFTVEGDSIYISL